MCICSILETVDRFDYSNSDKKRNIKNIFNKLTQIEQEFSHGKDFKITKKRFFYIFGAGYALKIRELGVDCEEVYNYFMKSNIPTDYETKPLSLNPDTVPLSVIASVNLSTSEVQKLTASSFEDSLEGFRSEIADEHNLKCGTSTTRTL